MSDNRSDQEHVIKPLQGQFEGWFPVPFISIVAGASGTGKTTFILQMLEAAAKGEGFLGHSTTAFPFVIVAKDRPLLSIRKTLKRMGIEDMERHYRTIGPGTPAEALEAMIAQEAAKPRLIVIEGLDIWTPDPLNMDAVSPVLHGLQGFCLRHDLAVVATFGCPKMKPGNGYDAPRDHVFGSQVWGRMTETIVLLQEDHKTGQRSLRVLPRDTWPERFLLDFEGGRLAWRPETEADRQEQIDPVKAWLQTHPDATWQEAHKVFPGTLKKSTFYDRRRGGRRKKGTH